MANGASNTSQVIDNGFGGSRNGNSINGVVIHHVAGKNGLNYVANKNSRNSHPTYHVANDGRVTGIVHPNRRPYSTAGRPDPEAVTFEIDNSEVGGIWPVSDAALNSVIDVIVDHYRQSPKFGNGIVANAVGQGQSGFFVAWHSQYKSTACPGPYLVSKLDYIVQEANRRAGSPAPTPTPPTPTPAPPTTGYAYQMVKGDGLTYQEPTGDWANRILRGVAKHGWLDASRNSVSDGVIGKNTRKAIQLSVRGYGYSGLIDGVLGKNTIKAVQRRAKALSGYRYQIDGIPGINTWDGYAKSLGE